VGWGGVTNHHIYNPSTHDTRQEDHKLEAGMGYIVLLGQPGPQTHDTPASASRVLGLLACVPPHLATLEFLLIVYLQGVFFIMNISYCQ
jgi:hypothetical protein